MTLMTSTTATTLMRATTPEDHSHLLINGTNFCADGIYFDDPNSRTSHVIILPIVKRLGEEGSSDIVHCLVLLPVPLEEEHQVFERQGVAGLILQDSDHKMFPAFAPVSDSGVESERWGLGCYRDNLRTRRSVIKLHEDHSLHLNPNPRPPLSPAAAEQ